MDEKSELIAMTADIVSAYLGANEVAVVVAGEESGHVSSASSPVRLRSGRKSPILCNRHIYFVSCNSLGPLVPTRALVSFPFLLGHAAEFDFIFVWT